MYFALKAYATISPGGAFALFLHTHTQEFTIQKKKNTNARGLARGGGGGGGVGDGRNWNWLLHYYTAININKLQTFLKFIDEVKEAQFCESFGESENFISISTTFSSLPKLWQEL